VYLAYSTKVVEGSPFNSLSSVPVMPWAGPEAVGASGAR
jgi:CreA protein